MALGSVIGGLFSIGGQLLANRGRSDAAQTAAAAAQPFSVIGPLGQAIFNPTNQTLAAALNPQHNEALQQIGQTRRELFHRVFQNVLDGEGVSTEVDRLRELAQPREDRARAQLRSQLLNRGRLGLGVGGGRTGQLFQPEIAALEEALAGADLNRVGAARSRQDQLLAQALGLVESETNLALAPTEMARPGIQARLPNSAINAIAQSGFLNARDTADFGFGAASGIGNVVDRLFGDLFGTGRGPQFGTGGGNFGTDFNTNDRLPVFDFGVGGP